VGGYFGALHTPGGYVIADVASAIQKEIRRGHEREALFWVTEIDLAGYTEYVWNRLRIIASEDVGVGDPTAVMLVRVLYDNWAQRIKKEKASAKAGRELPPESRLYLIHAVQALCRARKCRMVDHAYMLFYEGDRRAIGPKDIPDYAMDGHTHRGKKLGRGPEYFVNVSSKLENMADLEDPYEKEGNAAHLASNGGRVIPEYAEQQEFELADSVK